MKTEPPTGQITPKPAQTPYIYPGNPPICLSNYRPLRAASGNHEFLVVGPHASGVSRPCCGSPLTRKTAFFVFFRVSKGFPAVERPGTPQKHEFYTGNSSFSGFRPNFDYFYNKKWSRISGGRVPQQGLAWGPTTRNLSNQKKYSLGIIL